MFCACIFRPDNDQQTSQAAEALIHSIEIGDVVGVRFWVEANIPSRYQVCFWVHFDGMIGSPHVHPDISLAILKLVDVYQIKAQSEIVSCFFATKYV